MNSLSTAIRRRILLQFAGTQRNARRRKQRPGLELVSRDVDGQGAFDDVVVLYKAGDPDAKLVAEELVEDIRRLRPRSRGKPVALGAATSWKDPSRRSEAQEPVRHFIQLFLKQFGTRLATTEFVVSTLTGTPAQWTLLLEGLEQEGAITSMLRESPSGRLEFHRVHFPGSSQAQLPEHQLRLLGNSPFAWNVLLTGPTGAGKSYAAKRLHESWSRHLDRRGEFKPVNCAGIPANLLEAELFGHVKGAFTGATQDREGLFASANRGTVFLDEVGELPLELQAKLLTAIELHSEGNRWVRRIRGVGAEREHPVDVRLVLGTNRNLWEDAAAGRFRIDLLGRISTHAVALPSLADSRHRILGIYLERLEKMEKHVAGQTGTAVQFLLHREAITALQHFAFSPESRWTWNIRDVEQSAERLALLAWSHRRGQAGRVGIDLDIVSRETRFLLDRWAAMPGGSAAEPSPWADLREAMRPGAVDSLAELERWEARWLLQARRATRTSAEAWRWIRERNLLPFQGGQEKGNPTDSFKKRWARYSASWKETLS